jgi:succinate dehydrogenase flavin-adding protein (antitoxin of CptAB toxin-antitoxin module)
MPCKSYEDDWDRGSDERKIRELKAQCDKLARIACKAMTELEKNEVEDLLLLQDDEVRVWWKKHKEDDAREQARIAELLRRERVKEEALARLSAEEKELLGLTPVPTVKRQRKTSPTTKIVTTYLEQLEDKWPDLDEDE